MYAEKNSLHIQPFNSINTDAAYLRPELSCIIK